MWSFVHLDDAATATLTAIEHGAPGIYNVADDEPAPAAVWVTELAKVLGGKQPEHCPRRRPCRSPRNTCLPVHASDGLSNEKAKRELGWRPRYVTWREGFRNGLVDAALQVEEA